MGLSSRLRIPRPEVGLSIGVPFEREKKKKLTFQTFLYVMCLETGAALITLSLLLNKISGLYGLLALLTGYHLSSVQLSMYVYSLIVLGLTAYLFPYIRTQSPLQCLALAWLYLIDSITNAAYTAGFGVSWFMFISQNYGEAAPSDSTDKSSTSDGLNDTVFQPEGVPSILFICALWMMRIYFVLVMLSFARQTLRKHINIPRHTRLPTHSRNTSMASMADIDREPFSTYSPDGQGWKGRLGRIMVSVGRSYWLGEDEDSSNVNWVGSLHRRFRSLALRTDVSGPVERERRRRSGTGPPQPSPAVFQAAGVRPTGTPDQIPGPSGKAPPIWTDVR